MVRILRSLSVYVFCACPNLAQCNCVLPPPNLPNCHLTPLPPNPGINSACMADFLVEIIVNATKPTTAEGSFPEPRPDSLGTWTQRRLWLYQHSIQARMCIRGRPQGYSLRGVFQLPPVCNFHPRWYYRGANFGVLIESQRIHTCRFKTHCTKCTKSYQAQEMSHCWSSMWTVLLTREMTIDNHNLYWSVDPKDHNTDGSLL